MILFESVFLFLYEIYHYFLFSLMTKIAGDFSAVELVLSDSLRPDFKILFFILNSAYVITFKLKIKYNLRKVSEDKKLDFMISKRLLSKIECYPDVVEAALQAIPTRHPQRQKADGRNQTSEIGQRLAIRYNNVDCITLYEEHLTCLLHDNWLNDEVVDFFMVLLLELLNDYKNYDFCFLPASFLESIKRERDHYVLRRLNVFEKKFVIIPVCHNYHWTLVILCYMNNMAAALNGRVDAGCSPFMLYVDSLHWSINKRILQELRHSFSRELGIRLNMPDIKLGDDELPYKIVRVPKQKNLSDCGVYLLHYTECFIRYAVQESFSVPEFLDHSLKVFELSSGFWLVISNALPESTAFLCWVLLFARGTEMDCSESQNGSLRTPHDVEVMRKNLWKKLLEIQWNSDKVFQRKFCSLLLLKTKQQLTFSGCVEFGLLLGHCHVFGFELEASIPPKFYQVFSSYYGSPLISFNTGRRTVEQSRSNTRHFFQFCNGNFLKPLFTKEIRKRILSAAAVLIIRCVQLPLALGTSFERLSMIKPQNCATNNNNSTISEKHALIPGIFLLTKEAKLLHAFSLTNEETVLFDQAASQARRFSRLERLSILFCGHIGSGKSTRMRYFANRLLSLKVKTYLMDLDLGQSEMTLPGCISLTKLDEPLYGVNLKRMNKCEICYFYGEISPSNRPEIYLQLISRLYEEYVKITKYGVLLINCNGLGLDILLRIVDSLKPNEIFFFENCNIQMDEAAASRVARVALEERREIRFVRTSHLRVLRALDKKLLRSHYICNYFAHNYKEWVNFFNAPTSKLQWKKCFIAVAHVDVGGKFIMCWLKASGVVGLCHLNDHNAEDPCEQHYCNDASLPAIAPPGSVPLCLGFGIISYVDTDDQTIHLRTPLSSEQLDKVNFIVCGELEIPQQIFNCQSLLVSDDSKLTRKRNVQYMADIWRHWKMKTKHKRRYAY
ncbi:Polynucleotide 5'-hydroxyl-kinase NOL9 [Trichinella spiralis]|uniref:Polynucleotide 5'-hydroxyl-kinase NOL9 n=2 Tax=Trichinella spiralis TaxID=6334 RepID=A0A0V1B4Z0_TRISP|nr:Polynucleotide 5'-hydroxyl-kinase NOL9 [Trichinella spiralis]